MDAIKTNPKRTAAGNHLHQENINGAADFEVPKVDMQKAASFRPSKMSGRNVAWLVTFVAGMGVGRNSSMHRRMAQKTTVYHVWI